MHVVRSFFIPFFAVAAFALGCFAFDVGRHVLEGGISSFFDEHRTYVATAWLMSLLQAHDRFIGSMLVFVGTALAMLSHALSGDLIVTSSQD